MEKEIIRVRGPTKGGQSICSVVLIVSGEENKHESKRQKYNGAYNVWKLGEDLDRI